MTEDLPNNILAENVNLKAQLEARYHFENIVAESPAMRKVCEMIERVEEAKAGIIAGEISVPRE